MLDVDFRRIVPRGGDQREAFEELCCQLARRTLNDRAEFTRLRGAGGDGGVECFADQSDGSRTGWQAKYVFDVEALLTQATGSLTTAVKMHPTLTRYVICFPFDLTGPTGRRGVSGQEKVNGWRKAQEAAAAAAGRQLTIELWPASKLLSLLLEIDLSGGIRAYFFNNTILSPEWFAAHFATVKATAGPRYTPELNVKTDLSSWFTALGRTCAWSKSLDGLVQAGRKAHESLAAEVREKSSHSIFPAWPESLLVPAEDTLTRVATALDNCAQLDRAVDSKTLADCLMQLAAVMSSLSELESGLQSTLEAKYGQGRIDLPRFRQFMAEHMNSFPATNLDTVRGLVEALERLGSWLRSPAGSLAFAGAFILTGAAGSGKTHGVCDVAAHRLSEGLLTCVIFGHVFRGEPDPWTRMLEALGLPLHLGRDGLIDALNSAGEASGFPLIICIDAVNETRPLSYWRERLAAVVEAIARKPYLRLCVTCRTGFVTTSLPDHHGLSVIEHLGFAGLEHFACKMFFQHYGLKPPIVPILQPELLNPLYLKLVCETLRARGLDRLPSGWFGLTPAIRAFLDQKETQFAIEHETSVSAGIVKGSLRAIAQALAESGDAVLTWSQALEVISAARPQSRHYPVLEWLVRSDLLIEDSAGTGDFLGEEYVVRPAFERLGDFLVADSIMSKVTSTDLVSACRPGGRIHPFLSDPVTNTGIVGALSILIPERISGVELPDLVQDARIQAETLKITIRNFPWRDPNTFTAASESLVRATFDMGDFGWEALGAVMSIAWHPSAIDALWFHEFLDCLSLSQRDAVWCGYLHSEFDSHGTIRRLIDGAFELPLGDVELEVAERWATLLLWFTAAADRRVKDRASRAVGALLTARPSVIPSVLSRMLKCDDDEIRERTLLVCYGALIKSRSADVLRIVSTKLHTLFRKNPAEFDNALIRDHVRSILELAQILGVLSETFDPELPTKPVGSLWPLSIPSDEDIACWDQLPGLAQSCLDDDFFVYSMECLREWQHGLPKRDMGKWVLEHVADRFDYAGSGCEDYDEYMLDNHGGGRGKPVWAERIGKKYQWIALYQLASRLHDHVTRRRDSWEPAPLRNPLILAQERRMDPTLPTDIAEDRRHSAAWWIGSSYDFLQGATLSDKDWIQQTDRIPTLTDLLGLRVNGDQKWRLLVGCPSWDDRPEDSEWRKPYRRVWANIKSYLVPKAKARRAYDRILGRNFFGEWMPEGANWMYGFAGEYPWATQFNTEPEEWLGRGGRNSGLLKTYAPSWNELSVEWEYDTSLPRSFRLTLPAREFFSPGDLWWNGRDGYQQVYGRTVLRDPSVCEAGPIALVADADDLVDRLDRLGFSLIWTLVGEKQCMTGQPDRSMPIRTFSQVARLLEDGTLDVGEMVWFEDYNKATGLRAAKKG